jgi:formyltetrahydrofolate deformylase
VTENLDEEPTIGQDAVRVDHRHSIDDLTRLGADVERTVLSQALLGHCEDRIIRYGQQTMSSGVSRHLAGLTLIR